ncbi:MAG: hypothetical protein LBU88_07795 [Treponema sp.]|jgi:hypothetical protein|nr:hypothetical protein [Treponema sp.]
MAHIIMFPRGDKEVLESFRKLQEGEFFIEKRHMEYLNIWDALKGAADLGHPELEEWKKINKIAAKQSRLNLLFQYDSPQEPANPGPINILGYLEVMLRTHARLWDARGQLLDELNEIDLGRGYPLTKDFTREDLEKIQDLDNELDPLRWEFEAITKTGKTLKPHGATSEPTPNRLAAYDRFGRLLTNTLLEEFSNKNELVVVNRKMLNQVEKILADTTDWMTRFIGIKSITDDTRNPNEVTFGKDEKDKKILKDLEEIAKKLNSTLFKSDGEGKLIETLSINEIPEDYLGDLVNNLRIDNQGSLLDSLNVLTDTLIHIRKVLTLNDQQLQQSIDSNEEAGFERDTKLAEYIYEINDILDGHKKQSEMDHPNNSVQTRHIQDLAVNNDKILRNTITPDKLKSPTEKQAELATSLFLKTVSGINEVTTPNWQVIENKDLPNNGISIHKLNPSMNLPDVVEPNIPASDDWGVLINPRVNGQNTIRWLKGNKFLTWIANAETTSKNTINGIIAAFEYAWNNTLVPNAITTMKTTAEEKINPVMTDLQNLQENMKKLVDELVNILIPDAIVNMKNEANNIIDPAMINLQNFHLNIENSVNKFIDTLLPNAIIAMETAADTKLSDLNQIYENMTNSINEWDEKVKAPISVDTPLLLE